MKNKNSEEKEYQETLFNLSNVKLRPGQMFSSAKRLKYIPAKERINIGCLLADMLEGKDECAQNHTFIQRAI